MPALRSFLPAVIAGSLIGLAPIALAAPADAADYTPYAPSCDASPYTVPAGVTLLDLTVYGESGRSGTPGAYSAGAGGRGGKVEVTLPVTPGQTLWSAPNSKILRGGGQFSYGIGGNGSMVTTIDPRPYCGTGVTLPKDALVVVAGGGGGGADGDTGTGGSGGAAGQYGGNGGHNDKKDGAGGAPGSQTGGGGGGNNGSYPFVRSGNGGQSGHYLLGGHGGYDGAFDSAYQGAEPTPQMNAGGGGGGYYGGGGGGGASAGAAAGGGGGGSNYVTPSVPTAAPTQIFQAGVHFNGAAEYVAPRVDFVPVYKSSTSTIRTPLNPIHEGNPVTFSVTVTRNDGGFPQGGAVEFLDGSNVIATGQVDGNTGVATVSVSTLAPGTHQIQARFVGAKLWMQQVEMSWAENPNNQPLRLVVDAAFRPVAPVVTKDPVGSPKLYSSAGHFDAEATGNPTPAVQWQESPNNGRNWGNLAGANDRQLIVAASVAKSGYQYRAVFTSSAGIATTKAATMTVLKEPMPVVPVDASMFPGSEVPALTASYPYFTPRFGRSLAEEVTKGPKCTTTATSQSPVGTYPITCSGGVMPNYEPDFRTGTLTVAAHSHATSFTVPHAAHGWYRGDWIHLKAQGGADNNPVEFSIDHGTPAGLCELHGSTLVLSSNLTDADDCLVTAKQPGVTHAPPVTRAVRINVPHRNATLLAPARGAVGETAALTTHGYRLVGGTSTTTSDAVVTVRHHDAGNCSVRTVDGVVTVHYLAEGRCMLHAQQPQEDGRAGGTTEVVHVHLPIPQSVAFSSSFPTLPKAATTIALTTTSNSTTPVVLGTDTPAVCFVRGTTLYLMSRGSCVVVATQAAGGGYAAGVVRHTITVDVNDVVAFFPPPSGRVGQVITLTATKVPYGRPPVTFSVKSTAAVCTLSGAALTLRGVGSCVVVATQPYPGAGDMFLGSKVERTITVTP